MTGETMRPHLEDMNDALKTLYSISHAGGVENYLQAMRQKEEEARNAKVTVQRHASSFRGRLATKNKIRSG